MPRTYMTYQNFIDLQIYKWQYYFPQKNVDTVVEICL